MTDPSAPSSPNAASPAVTPPGATPPPKPPSPEAAVPSAPTTWQPPRRRRATQVVLVMAGLAAVALVLWTWQLPPFTSAVKTTQNAFVRGRTVVIAPQVSGYVMAVSVQDYAEVPAGAMLARVDDRIYRARVAQARAQVAAQEALLANHAQERATRLQQQRGRRAEEDAAIAARDRMRADDTRMNALFARRLVSATDHERSNAALRQAQSQAEASAAGVAVASEGIRATEVDRARLVAAVEAAKAALTLAEIDLGNTEIRAPEAGQLGEVGVRVGQYVSNGSPLMQLVPPDVWVLAHFKEAQTGAIRVGQSVVFTVDALPGMEFDGTVERLAPAAGSEFATVKTDTSNGNFVKIPQRLGVRIAVHSPSETPRLLPGMSVTASVFTDDGPSSITAAARR